MCMCGWCGCSRTAWPATRRRRRRRRRRSSTFDLVAALEMDDHLARAVPPVAGAAQHGSSENPSDTPEPADRPAATTSPLVCPAGGAAAGRPCLGLRRSRSAAHLHANPELPPHDTPTPPSPAPASAAGAAGAPRVAEPPCGGDTEDGAALTGFELVAGEEEEEEGLAVMDASAVLREAAALLRRWRRRTPPPIHSPTPLFTECQSPLFLPGWVRRQSRHFAGWSRCGGSSPPRLLLPPPPKQQQQLLLPPMLLLRRRRRGSSWRRSRPAPSGLGVYSAQTFHASSQINPSQIAQTLHTAPRPQPPLHLQPLNASAAGLLQAIRAHL